MLKQLLQQAMHLHGIGQLTQAESLYRRVVKLDKRNTTAHANLGLLLQTQGRNLEAVKSLRKAALIDPGKAKTHFMLGVVYQNLGRLKEAADSYRRAVFLKPGYVEAGCNLGIVEHAQGQLIKAVSTYRATLELQPDLYRIHFNLGNVLHQLGRLQEAATSYRSAIRHNSKFAEAWNNLADVQKGLGETEKALYSYRKAIGIKPAYFQAHTNLGTMLRDLGKLDDARTCYRQAIKIDPTYAEAHRLLASARKYTERDDHFQQMESMLEKGGIESEQKMHLLFALAKANEDLKQYDRAFDYLLKGNAIKRSTYQYQPKQSQRLIEYIQKHCDKRFIQSLSGIGVDDETPVFIVGMPRSGTSLVEQILASHPNLAGGGELDLCHDLIHGDTNTKNALEAWRAMIGQADRALPEFARHYLEGLKKIAPKYRRISDKMPSNFLYIGIIHLALPKAKIIHCVRDPLDTCLSIFKNFFVGEHPYAYQLEELGAFYRLYQDLMRHWHAVLPGAIHDIHYETLVADQEGESRKLLRYCQLPWDDACIAFHDTHRQVNTASAVQVRKPIYMDSVQLWKHYETPLQPLRNILVG